MSHHSITPSVAERSVGNGHDTDGQLSEESDFSDFESDEFDEENYGFTSFHPRSGVSVKSSGYRCERIRELVATELEYIHDLEILMEITTSDGTKEKYYVLDMKTLLGNITQVMDVARRFSLDLKEVAHHREEDMIVGKVFLKFVEELTQAYKVYCSSYNIDVLPLLKKYENEESTTAALKQLAEELRGQKKHLLDLNCVLIKPVQRVLKYPLYLYELVQATPNSHEDYSNLEEAKRSFLSAAKDINEYTRTMDLVHKYRDDDHSLRHKMRHVRLHSLARKSARVTRKISQKFGVPHQDKALNSEVKELGIKFHCIQKSSEMLIKNATSLVEAMRSRHTAELFIAEALLDLFPEVNAAQKVKVSTLEACNKVLQMFDNEVQSRVLHPARQIMILCEGPASIFQKTRKMLVDFDIAQLKLQAALEPSRIASLVEESAEKRSNYEVLSKQLVTDLPIFIDNSVAILTLCTKSLISAHMYLQGHLVKLCLQLAQDQGINYMSMEEAQNKVKEHVDRHLLSLPEAYQKKCKRKDTVVKRIEKMEQVELRSKSQERSGEGSRSSASTEFFKSLPSISKGRSRSYPINKDKASGQQIDNQGTESHRTVSSYGHFRSWSPSIRMRKWKSQFYVAGTSENKPKVKSLEETYNKEDLYKVIQDHQSEVDNELDLRVGERVAVLKKQDPMGGEGRWVVDNGEKIGIVRKSCLEFCKDHDNGNWRKSHPSSKNSVTQCIPSPESCKPPSTLLQLFTPLTTDKGGTSHEACSVGEDAVLSSDDWSDEEYVEGSKTYTAHLGATASNGSTQLGLGENDAVSHREISSGEVKLKHYVALYDFTAAESSQLSVKKGQVVVGIHTEHLDWWYVKDDYGSQGYVPSSYLVLEMF